jgi:voltage-gated potassium channel
MPIFVARFVRLVRTRIRGWRLSLAIAGFVFMTSWVAMWLVEPASNEITAPQNYWWWFLVTSATVGYGDFFPMSGAGHLVGAYVIVGGIVALTILFTELAAAIQNAKGKRMKGVVDLDVSGHTVILGYTPGRTQRIVAELRIEGGLELVLCAWDEVAEHPMPEQAGVRFVRGDLTAADVLARACVERAATVVIDGRDDNETLAIAVTVDHLNPRVHLVVALRDMSRCQHLRYVNPNVQCVQWHMPYLLTEEALDPGITQVYAELMSSAGSGNTYSARLPAGLAGRTFGECQTQFGKRFGATVIAVRQGDGLAVSPAWDTPIQDGAVLYYLADHRIDESRLAQTR